MTHPDHNEIKTITSSEYDEFLTIHSEFSELNIRKY